MVTSHRPVMQFATGGVRLVNMPYNESTKYLRRSRTRVALPKFSSELMQRTGTDRTEPKVRFSPVPVLQFWLRFGSRFSEFSKIPEPFENRSKFLVEMPKKACKIAYV